MENKKNSKGLVITLVIFMLVFAACAALLFTGVIKSPMVKEKDCTETKCSVDTKTDDDTKKDSKVEDTGLKEGYLVYENDYKIYGIYNYVELASVVVGYNDNIYLVDGGDNQVGCIKKLGELQFDENSKAKCGWEHGTDSDAYKFTTKESELAKVVFRVPIGSTSGYKTPILIRKDGSIETTNKQTANAVKDYKIKDFIEETCIEHPTDGNRFPGDCLKGQYKVILQDGTEKTIEVTYGE